MNKLKISAAAVAIMTMPALVLAADSIKDGGAGKFGTLISNVTELIGGYLIPFVIALAVLAFVYGVFTYFIAGGADEDKRKEGRNLMLYAIIGFVAIVALWGIVSFVVDAFGFSDNGDVPETPTIELNG